MTVDDDMTKVRTPIFISALHQTWREFALDTTIHGVKYSVGRRRIDRWVWTLIPFVSAGAAAVLMVIMYRNYFAEPTRALYESQFAPLEAFAFPAISICPPRKLAERNINAMVARMKFPENMTRERFVELANGLLGYTIAQNNTSPEDMKLLDVVFGMNEFSPDTVMQMLTPTCRRLLVRCRWEGKDLPCTDIFIRALTRDGYCCSFNYNTDFSESTYRAIHTPYFGPMMGLSVVVDTIGTYNKQVYHTMDSFKLMIHNSQTFAGRMTTEIVMPLFSEVSVGLSPLKVKIGPQAILLPPTVRKCYMGNELPLKHFALYSRSDCIVECEITKSVERCGCQSFVYPKKDRDVICNATNILCLYEHITTIQSVNWESNCDCPTQCSENSTDLTVDTTDLTATAHGVDPLYTLLTENQTLVHFFMAKQFGTIVRKAVITYWVDLLSNFGGVFSLFLGLSFLSILEMIYFAGVRLPRTYAGMLRKEKANKKIMVLN